MQAPQGVFSMDLPGRPGFPPLSHHQPPLMHPSNLSGELPGTVAAWEDLAAAKQLGSEGHIRGQLVHSPGTFILMHIVLLFRSRLQSIPNSNQTGSRLGRCSAAPAERGSTEAPGAPAGLRQQLQQQPRRQLGACRRQRRPPNLPGQAQQGHQRAGCQGTPALYQ